MMRAAIGAAPMPLLTVLQLLLHSRLQARCALLEAENAANQPAAGGTPEHYRQSRAVLLEEVERAQEEARVSRSAPSSANNDTLN